MVEGTRVMKAPGFLLAVLSAVGLVIWTACDSSTSKVSPGASVETLTLGTSRIDLSSLIWVAKERGYFAEQGLEINFKLYESGHLAAKDLLAGRLDLATASEFAAVRAFMQSTDVRVISVLDRSEDQLLVARKDRGIGQVSDLRGKRIGLPKGSSAEYYFQVMLILADMPVRDVHVVDLLPSEQVKAIAAGDVDAVMAWEPFATGAKKELGTNGVSWSGQSGQRDHWVLLSTNEVLEKRSRSIRRFLAALASAEDFVKKNDAAARRIVAKELGDAFEDALWPNHRFQLGLDRPLVLKMGAEITWLKSLKGPQVFSMPDARELIHVDALKSVRPEKVELLH